MTVLTQEKDPEEHPDRWQERIMTKFSSPEVILRNYSGQRLELVAQIVLTIKQGECCDTVPVLVQKNAPHDLLLGTDTQSLLGFSLCVATDKNQAVDLLNKEQSSQGTTPQLKERTISQN